MRAPDHTGVNIPVLFAALVMTALVASPLIALLIIGLQEVFA
jgi:hypothetical protein